MASIPRITYYIKYAAIYLIFFVTFLISGLDKLTSGGVPEWFTGQFGGTFLNTFPSLPVTYYVLAILELLVAVILVVSLVRMEFQPGHAKDLLKLGLVVGALTFVVLAFGQRITNEFGGAANLFFYFGATLVTLLVIENETYKP